MVTLRKDAEGKEISPEMGIEMIIAINRLYNGEITKEWTTSPEQEFSLKNLSYSVYVNLSLDPSKGKIINERHSSTTFCGLNLKVNPKIDKGTIILWDSGKGRELGRIVNLKEPLI